MNLFCLLSPECTFHPPMELRLPLASSTMWADTIPRQGKLPSLLEPALLPRATAPAATTTTFTTHYIELPSCWLLLLLLLLPPPQKDGVMPSTPS